MVTTKEKVEKVHDLVFQEAWVTNRQIVEDIDVVYNIITTDLTKKKLSLA